MDHGSPYYPDGPPELRLSGDSFVRLRILKGQSRR